MKPYDNDDELERALFALPLEEPPADLRASILAATIYHRPVPVSMNQWEVWGLGALCAVLVWMLIFVARGSALPEISAMGPYLDRIVQLFATPTTLFWIALGGGAVAWISQVNLTVAPGYQRASRR
jgi:hypothetical protein